MDREVERDDDPLLRRMELSACIFDSAYATHNRSSSLQLSKAEDGSGRMVEDVKEGYISGVNI